MLNALHRESTWEYVDQRTCPKAPEAGAIAVNIAFGSPVPVPSNVRFQPRDRDNPKGSMSFWNKIFGGSGSSESVDYYEEGLSLAREGKFHEALTSLRLALKESPGDPIVLQQIAIAYTRIGMNEEAVKTYRHVLSRNPDSPGAHYGLAFLLLHSEERQEAVQHLEAFLQGAPVGPEASDHIAHARSTLAELTGRDAGPEPQPKEA